MAQTSVQFPPVIRPELIEAAPPAGRLYTGRFFLVFTAVVFFMTGVALQFHFAQYVEHLGYGVDVLGRMLSISVLGTLLIRLHIGRWIDRVGGKPVWVTGALIVAAAVGAMQFARDAWLVTALRTVWMMAMALVMTTVSVFAAHMAPPGRRAESLGILGLAGFTGMIIGPTVGDVIFAGGGASMTPYRVFFSASAACSLASVAIIAFLRRPPTAVPGTSRALTPGRHFSQLRVIRDHWPGAVMLMGLVFSVTFCVQNSYLERFADARGFHDIKVFFLTYGPSAMVLRVAFRRVPARFGRTRTLIGGSIIFVVGLLCLVGVYGQWQLILPGILMGAGHAFLFPSMVDLAADRLPPEHRGTGTALILAAGDLGMLIGYWALGEMIDAFGFSTALTALAALMAGSAAYFTWATRKVLFHRRA